MESTVIMSGPAKVIASGSVTSFKGHPIEITFGPSDERLTFILAFKEDKNNPDFRLSTKVIENTLELTYFNVDGDFGTKYPVMSGDLSNNNLYLHLRVSTLNKSEDMTLHYTIYTVSENA